ncbi:MAG: hypothetical protein H7288_05120 [Kineosporiaceae bacterium]|nr:hypothetical protein [Aeromicrobium sp.]
MTQSEDATAELRHEQHRVALHPSGEKRRCICVGGTRWYDVPGSQARRRASELLQPRYAQTQPSSLTLRRIAVHRTDPDRGYFVGPTEILNVLLLVVVVVGVLFGLRAFFRR